MRKLFFVFAICAACVMVSCNSNPLDVDVSDIEVDVPIERFDKEFRSCSSNLSYSEIGKFAEKYPVFFDMYNSHIISCGSYSEMAYYDCLKAFFSDYSVVEAYNAVENEFVDMEDLQETLNGGFRHLLYYYPYEELPRVVTFVAGFNQSIVLMDGYVGIGLDKYLGADCNLYDMVGTPENGKIPDYAKRELQRERIPIDIMSEMFRDRHQYNPSIDNLANRMIYNGISTLFYTMLFNSALQHLKAIIR